MSTLGKGKAPVSTNGVEIYSKETLGEKIYRLTTTNAQLITDKIKTEKVRVNLKIDRVRLFGEKNSLVVKREELRAKIVMLNVAGSFNIPVHRHQDLFLGSI